MKAWKEKLVRLARKNVLVRGLLIVYYFFYYTWRDLGRLLLMRKRQAVSCMVVIVLVLMCLRGSFSSAWDDLTGEAQVSGGNAETESADGAFGSKEDTENAVEGEEGNGSVSGGDAGAEDNGEGEKDFGNRGEVEEGSEKTAEGEEVNGSVSGGDAGAEDNGEGEKDFGNKGEVGEGSEKTAEGEEGNGNVSGGDAGAEDNGEGEKDFGNRGEVGEGSEKTAEGEEGNGNVSGGDAATGGNGVLIERRIGEKLQVKCQGADFLDGVYVGASEIMVSVSAVPFLKEELVENDSEGRFQWEYTEITSIFYSLGGEVFVREGDELQLKLSESACMSLYCWGMDDYGHETDIYEMEFWLDLEAPEIRMSEIEREDGKKYLHVEIEDKGEASSGIASHSCTVNGMEARIQKYEVKQGCSSMLNPEGIRLLAYDVVLDVDKVNEVVIAAKDELGNEAVYETTIEQNIVLDIDMPDRIDIFMVPWLPDQQITTNPIVITNNSMVDIDLVLTDVNVRVRRAEGEDIEQKSCTLLLKIEAPGSEIEPVILSEGDSENLFSVHIPGKESEDGGNREVSLVLSGNITEGSEELWRDGDLKVTISFSFRAAKQFPSNTED